MSSPSDEWSEDALASAAALLPPDDSVLLVAVSGGADSIVLWDLLERASRWRVVAYHLDHALRAESAADAAFVAGIARGSGRRLISERADIAALARRWSCGLEAAGRRHRYQRLRDIAGEVAAAAIATAHHRDDQAETVLMNLLRGAGPAGMRGIPPRRLLDGVPLIRPLLPYARARLREEAVRRGLSWREDASNDDERFRRNLVRKRVLPVLEAAVPGVADELVALAERTIVPEDADIVPGAGEIAFERLPTASVDRARLWRRLLVELGIDPSRARIRQLDALLAAESGCVYRIGRWRFVRDRDAIAWESAQAHPCVDEVLIEGPGTFRRGDQVLTVACTAAPADPRTPSGEAWLDADRVRFPLRWRQARPGERWLPLGSPGRQTVGKYLADRKVRASRRAEVAVIADQDGIAWIPGFGVAERARVSAGCARAVHGTMTDSRAEFPFRARRGRPESAAMNAHVSAVILAAGKGTRMGSDLAKVLHPLAGRPLIAHVLDTCRELGLGQTVVVVGWQRERVEEAVRAWQPTCVLQDRQLGTGHAVLAAEPAVRGDVVLVLYGDCPLTPAALLQEVLSKHARTGAACTGVAAHMADPTGYGRMVTDVNGRLARIVEHKEATPDQRAITLVNSGIYAFARADLFRCLKQVRPQNAQGEYYLTDVVAMLVAEGKLVELVTTEDVASVLGVNTPADLATAERLRAARAR
jgi:tRNA(Ile)-lysidine synthase